MSPHLPGQVRPAEVRPDASLCPTWCVAPHGLHDGEEDWVHTSEPLWLVDEVSARLCMTVHPDTRVVDGPYVLIGAVELTPGQAADLGLALQALAGAAGATVTRAAP